MANTIPVVTQTQTPPSSPPAATRATFVESDFYILGYKRTLVCIGLSLVLFISALDSSIVSVALPIIGAEFDDYTESSWIVTSYLITYTAFLPIVSKFTDILGRRPVLVWSCLFFMLWSGACGGAKSMKQLIVFRAFQGIGGSAIYSAVIVTFSTMVPRTELSKYTPIIGMVFAISSVAGPLVGGAIVSNIHWGWIFFVNLPIGAVGVALLAYALSDPHGSLTWSVIARRVDWIGSFLMLAFSVLLAFGLQVGGTEYPWVSAAVLAPLIISIIIFPIFLYAETKHIEPLVPLRLFRQRNFIFMMIFIFCLGAGFFTIVIFLPQRMEVVTLLSAVTSGVRMLPMLVLIGVLSPIAAAIIRKTMSYKYLSWVASALGPIGAGLLVTLRADTDFPKQYGYEVIVGVSVGVMLTVSTIIVQYSTDRPDLAVATGFQTFVRQLGSLIAIAMSTAILNGRVDSIFNTFATNSSSPLASAELRSQIKLSPATVLSSGILDAQTVGEVQDAYSDGFSKVFVAAAAWLTVAALSTFGIVHIFPPHLRQIKKLAVGSEDTEGKGDFELKGDHGHGSTSVVRDEMDE